MTKIVADSKEARSILMELRRLVTQNGGFLHKKLVLRVSRGNFSGHVTGSLAQGEKLIFIPDACLPSINDFYLSLEGDQIVFEPGGSHVTELHSRIFDLIVQLFNLTGKIAGHRQTSLWPNLVNSPDIFDCFKNISFGGVNYYQLFMSQQFDEIVLQSFLHSREITYTNAHGLERKKVLMPFIDFLNHHSRGSELGHPVRGRPETNGLTVVNPAIKPKSGEVLIAYNNLDAMGSYLNYGFQDSSASFLRSFGVRYESDSLGTIQINADVLPRSSTRAPPELADLAEYYPSISLLRPSGIALSHLLLPADTRKDGLRRVLFAALKNAPPGDWQDENLKTAVDSIIELVLDVNLRYYRPLGELLRSNAGAALPDNVRSDFLKVIDTQLGILTSYMPRSTETCAED